MGTADVIGDLWQLARGDLRLPGDEVHVWRVSLDRTPSEVEELFLTLTPDERDRAGRFYFRKDQDHFVVARGALRNVLARYMELGELGAHQLRFRYTSHGKPYLECGESAGDIRFNLSHSNGVALLAVTRGRELGVDIEYVRPGVTEEQIAESFFSSREVAMLRALSKELQAQAFFNCWTRKEAYIKAKGEGLSIPLNKFDVSLAPGEPAAILEIRIDPAEISRWSIMELRPGPRFAAALVVESHDWRLTRWQWDMWRSTP